MNHLHLLLVCASWGWLAMTCASYAKNDTELFFEPWRAASSFTRFGSDSSNYPFYSGGNEQPEIPGKPSGRSLPLGELWTVLPLFNQLDTEAAEQNDMISVPSTGDKGEKKNTAESGDQGGKENLPTVKPGDKSTTDWQASKQSPDDGKRPPDGSVDEHTHIDKGACCYAPGCNGQRCRCQKCLSVSAMAPKNGAEEDHETRPAIGQNSIFQLFLRRSLTGELIRQSQLDPFFYRRRLEQLAAVKPTKVPTDEQGCVQNVVSLDNGYIATIMHQDRFRMLVNKLIIWSRNKEGWTHYDELPVSPTHHFTWPYTLSEGGIVLHFEGGHAFVYQAAKSSWKMMVLDISIFFLKHIWYRCRYNIPYRLVQLMSKWYGDYVADDPTESMLRRRRRLTASIFFNRLAVNGPYVDSLFMIGPDNGLILLRLSLSWPESLVDFTLVRSSTLGSGDIDIVVHKLHSPSFELRIISKAIPILLEDGSVNVIFLLHQIYGARSHRIWSENLNEENPIAITGSQVEYLSPGRFIEWDSLNSENLLLWEHSDGGWQSSTLIGDSEQNLLNQGAKYKVSALRNGWILVVENGNSVKVFAKLDGSWQAVTIYQPHLQPYRLDALEIGENRIAVWTESEVFIWDW